MYNVKFLDYISLEYRLKINMYTINPKETNKNATRSYTQQLN